MSYSRFCHFCCFSLPLLLSKLHLIFKGNFNLDSVWVVVGGILFFFMQAGFALIESGSVRSKNTVNVLMKNYMDTCIGGIIFWLFGFGLMFGQPDRRAGYDFPGAGHGGGAMSLTGETNGPPTKTGFAIADIFCGLYAASSIQAAAARRIRRRGTHRRLASRRADPR